MRKVSITSFFAIVFLANYLLGQTTPYKLRDKNIKSLQESIITYKQGKEEELHRSEVKYSYDRKKEAIQIVKDKNRIINIRWVKKDSLIRRYEYHQVLDGSQSDIHELQEVRFEDGLKITKTRFLPLTNKENYFGLEYVPIEDFGIGQIDSLSVDKTFILSKIPIMIEDTIGLFQIQVELTDPQNSIHKLLGVYGSSSSRKNKYELKHIKLSKKDGKDQHILYTYLYRKYEKDFQIVSKIRFDRHDNGVKYFRLHEFSSDQNIDRIYKYDRRSNWIEMQIFSQGKLSKVINRKIKYYKRNKT